MIYVDEAINWQKRIGRCGPWWCHMTADSREELHAFAARLGLQRRWFQDAPNTWHYDLTTDEHGGGMRGKALAMGAQAITRREAGALIWKRTEERRANA